ncbi:NAD-dependent deacylase [bacterium]|nr:NAD-dependent deacylase [bacterium]
MRDTVLDKNIQLAAQWIKTAQHTIVFTGAGISVESGIPPFRGEGGLWNNYNPQCVELGYFTRNPKTSWPILKEIFYDFMGKAHPNPAHIALAKLEKTGHIKWLITQNIDALHQSAGTKNISEYHGTIDTLHCRLCLKQIQATDLKWKPFPPVCFDCGGPLKPDFVFFGEMIPVKTMETSLGHAQIADLIIVIGSTGEVMPAAMLPGVVKHNGGRVIEINIEPSNYTENLSDCFLKGKASEILQRLTNAVLNE